MSYSKGPWRWDRNRVLGTSGEVIALAIHNNDDTQANAKLMAAAPRMLEALKVALNRMEVVHWVDSVGGHGPDNVLEQEIEMVKKAIQQAEGGE